MKVRRADREDLDEIVKLDEMLSDQHAEIDDYFLPAAKMDGEEIRDWLKGVLDNDDSMLLVGEADDKLVSYFIGAIEETKTFIAPDREGRMAVIYVEPSWRRKGFAREVTKIFKRWCKEKGVNSIRLSFHSDNSGAINAWRSLGFEEYMKRMRMDI